MWLHKAADQGDAAAQFNLGLLSAEGQGTPKDESQAALWYRKAAMQQYAPAQLALGVCYANGAGTPQDYATAYMWISLAVARFPDVEAANREAATQSRDAIAAKMTAEQLAEGRRLAQDWASRRPAPDTTPGG